MHPLLRVPYAMAGAAAEAAVALVPPGQAKWRRALVARRGLFERYEAFAASRDTRRPLAWFHAPSVGEALQALPVTQRLRARSTAQLALTWFSPSAEAFSARFDVDFRDYLPFDTTRGAAAALDGLRPTALVYSKLDVWPVLTHAASERGVRLAMISATVSEGSGRRRSLAKRVLRDAYARLDAVGAISAEDAERLLELGVRREVVRVTGDTRYDQVWERARGIDRARAVLDPFRDDRPTVVAGSTWPADEAHLTAAWESVRTKIHDARLIIAPHEPTDTHIGPLESWARRVGLQAVRLSAASSGADVVIVDRVGVLADLYSRAQVALVGGGFASFGLHSVLEPAAFGVPVLFGPEWRNSRDAAGLLNVGGARSIGSAGDLARQLEAWLSVPAERARAGTAAAAFVEAGLGAAERATALVEGLL